MHVEIIEGRLHRAGSSTPALQEAPYERIPKIGQSLGPRVTRNILCSGTLGLYLTIDKGGVKERFGVTNDHVAMPKHRPAPGKLYSCLFFRFIYTDLRFR